MIIIIIMKSTIITQIEELFKIESELYTGWIKNLLGLSTVALTILVSMMPRGDSSCPEKYFLALSWILLALCIPCSLAAAFRPTIEARKKAHTALDFLKAGEGAKEIPASQETKKLFKITRVLFIAQVISILTFCLSFASLTIYACLSIL